MTARLTSITASADFAPASWLSGRLGARVLSVWLGLLQLQAQLPTPTLTWVFPPGAQAGTTNVIQVAGTDLDDASGLLFSDHRIVGEPVAGKPGEFSVRIPEGVPGRLHELRVVGRFGASNPRPFVVGTTAEIAPPATNSAPGPAVTLPFDTVISQRLPANSALWFRFDARAGERLFVRVSARDLDSRLVPEIRVLDARDAEVAVVRRRELLDFTVPTSGAYHLRINDQTYRGGDEFHFRLLLTRQPQVDFALPLITKSGPTNLLHLFGRSLPGGSPLRIAGPDGNPLERLALPLGTEVSPTIPGSLSTLRRPAAASLPGDPAEISGPNGSAWLPSLPVLPASSPPVQVTPGEFPLVPLPATAAGLFAPPAPTGIRFEAKKGEVFWIETASERLGFPTDPIAVIQRERSTKGERGETLYADVLELGDTDTNLGDREFNTASRDATARFEAPETGTYRVVIRDLFNTAPGRPAYPWWLNVRPETPDFRLAALALPPPKANNDDRRLHVSVPVLRRGQTMPVRVFVFRRDGFNGEVELSATNLPPGVSAAITRIAAGQNSGVILLTANETASGTTVASLRGRAAIGGRTVEHAAPLAFLTAPVADFNQEAAAIRFAANSVVSVCAVESAPVMVQPTAETVMATAGGKVSVPLRIRRTGEFNGAFSLKPAGHPELDKAKELAVAEKSTNAVLELNLAETKLPAGRHTLWLQGTVAGKYRNQPEAVATADAELKAAEQALAQAKESDKAAAQARKQAAESAKKAAEERAKPRDVTVPLYSAPFIVEVTAPKEAAK